MRQLRQLLSFIDTIPTYLQIGIAIFLVCYSFTAIYGRFNLKFGAKMFSKIPPEQIRTNWEHIISYTIVPTIITIVYLVILTLKYF